MTRIHTPVKNFTGTVVGVQFNDGTGETDDPTALAYFERHGYTIGAAKNDTTPEEEPAKANDGEETAKDSDTVIRPAGNASKQAWYEYALANGFEEEELDGLDRNELRDLVDD